MGKIKRSEETTIVGGTEMKKNQVAYILPIAMIIVGLLWALSGFKPAWWLFSVGAFLVVAVFVGNVTKKK